MAQNSSESAILIIGAGTWGSSTALELARRGFTGIKVLDSSSFPSAIAAGNDLNKIAEEGKQTPLLNTKASIELYLMVLSK